MPSLWIGSRSWALWPLHRPAVERSEATDAGALRTQGGEPRRARARRTADSRTASASTPTPIGMQLAALGLDDDGARVFGAEDAARGAAARARA